MIHAMQAEQAAWHSAGPRTVWGRTQWRCTRTPARCCRKGGGWQNRFWARWYYQHHSPSDTSAHPEYLFRTAGIGSKASVLAGAHYSLRSHSAGYQGQTHHTMSHASCKRTGYEGRANIWTGAGALPACCASDTGESTLRQRTLYWSGIMFGTASSSTSA